MLAIEYNWVVALINGGIVTMKDKIIKLWNKIGKEGFLYIVFGGLTTLISVLSYGLCTEVFNWGYTVGQVVSWILSVTFAFFTNKFYVFEKKDRKLAVMLKEGISFYLVRLVSGLAEWGLLVVMIDVWSLGEMPSKILTTIFVIIANYITSKFWVFKKND